jgi:hypothetical protein
MSDETKDSNQSDAGSSAPKELPAPPRFESDAASDQSGTQQENNASKRTGCMLTGCALAFFIVLAVMGSLSQIAKGIFHA